MSHEDKPYYQCPRFDKCSVNHCPLDPEQDRRLDFPGEPRCTIAKSIRYRIGSKYPKLLKYQGLKAREWAGKQRWEALGVAEKEIVLSKGFKKKDTLETGSKGVTSDKEATSSI